MSGMKNLRSWLPGYLFLLPSMCLFLLFMYVPIAKGVVLSFQSWSISGNSWIGFSNYITSFQNPVFMKALGVTFLFTVGNVLLGIGFTVAISLMIDPLSSKLQSFFKAALYLPSVAPVVIVTVIWSWMYDPTFGMFNYLLGQLGFDSVLWLADPNMALISLIIMSVATGLGPGIVILVAALGGIPKDYYEAGKIDGTNAWYEIWHIKLPLAKPALLYLFVVNTVASFQVFAPVYLMTSGGPNGATTTLGFLIYENGFKKFDFGMASAQAVILLLIVMAIAIIQFKWMSSDVEY